MSQRLDALVDATRQRLAERKRSVSLSDLEKQLPHGGLSRKL